MVAAGTRSTPDGPGWTSPRSRPGSEVVPRIGTDRVCGTAAGIAPRLTHSTTPRRPASSTMAPDSACQRSSGSGPAMTSRSRSATRARRIVSSGQVELGQPAVDDLERRAPGAIIEQLVRVERRHDRSLLAEELGERDGGGVAGIDPAIERADECRCDEVARIAGTPRGGQRVQAHARRIVGGPP